jgi:Domain of unknown function (DUF6089)
MKGIKFTPLFFFLSICLQAQTILVHIGGGLVNYGGDLQPRVYTLNQARGFIQAGMSLQWSSHYIIDYSIAAGKVGAADAHSTAELKTRNLSFFSNIGEATLTFEYDLNDISYIHKFTPYGFAGVGAFHFKPYAFDTAGNKVYLKPLGTEGQELPEYGNKNFYHLVQFNIPFGLGIKYALSKKIALCGEFGFRKIFTDYLDDVSRHDYVDTALLHAARGPIAAKMSFRADEIPGSTFKITWQRGNPNAKDTYYTFMIKVIFSFEKGVFLY